MKCRRTAAAEAAAAATVRPGCHLCVFSAQSFSRPTAAKGISCTPQRGPVRAGRARTPRRVSRSLWLFTNTMLCAHVHPVIPRPRGGMLHSFPLGLRAQLSWPSLPIRLNKYRPEQTRGQVGNSAFVSAEQSSGVIHQEV